jgi:hypothetical protein
MASDLEKWPIGLISEESWNREGWLTIFSSTAAGICP